ncbi:MAG: carboxypeptidase regulatory-like domain-containing protein [Bacteroidaceae bacterium]|nr:carboxypeptidase regulatory-like domain-containing protein [Bacteroidaceae bacterium]
MKRLRTFFTLALCLSLWAQTALAADCTLETTSNYTIMLESSNQMRIRFPAYSKDGYDCWIVDGTISIQIDDTNEKATLFYCEVEHDIANSDYNPYMYCYKGVDGTMTQYRDQGYSSVSIGNTRQYTTVPCQSNKSDDAYINLLWKIPLEYRGKKVTITWSIHHNGNVSEPNKYIDIKETRMTIPDAPYTQEPTLMDPIVSYNTGRPNQIMVPYMLAANNIQSMTAYYTEVNGADTTSRTVSLSTSSSDFIWLNAERPVRNLYLKTTYTNTEGDPVTTTSDRRDMPILHQPKSMTATVQPDGKVLLSWEIATPRWEDIMPNDSWEVQRNISGSSDPNDGGWTTLGQVMFDGKETRYTLTDENLLQVYSGQPVYYRVRRAITALWGWTSQSGYAMTSLPAMFRLPVVTEAKAERNGTWTDTSHGVTVQFRLGGPDRDSQGRLILRSADDWKAFAKLVNEGQDNTDALMAADIDLGTESLTMVGTTAHPYTGTFDGNGHTLTFNPKDTLDQSYVAPFQSVGNATIRNLHTQGSLASSRKFAAGIVAHIQGSNTLTLECCRSSVRVGSTVNGDATNGGILAYTPQNSDLTLRNCLFDGIMDGTDCYNNGGLVGWGDGRVKIENCLFAPTDINTKTNGCASFARMRYANNLTVTNSYCLTPYEKSAGNTATSEGKTPAEILAQLGSSWTMEGQQLVPVVTYETPLTGTLLWDPRAKLVLTTYMTRADGETAKTQRRELTDDERLAGQVDVDLTMPCMYHSFGLAVERGESPLPLDGQEENVDRLEYDPLAKEGTLSLRTAQDWEMFAKRVNEGENTLEAIMLADITLPRTASRVGITPECRYSGIFDGNGHTLTIDMAGPWAVNPTGSGIDVAKDQSVPFPILGNATLKNLHVAGQVESYQRHLAGLAACVYKGSKVNINHCRVSAQITNYIHGRDGRALDARSGGFIGLVQTDANVSFYDCLFDGVIKSGYQLNGWGGFVGWRESGALVECRNTLFDPTNLIYDEPVTNTSTLCGNGVTSYMTPVYCTRFMGIEQGQDATGLSPEKLAKSYSFQVDCQWAVVDGRARPIIKSDNKNDFYFDSNAKLTALQADTLQDAVSLSWETDGGDVDYYRIKRYDQQQPDMVTTLEEEYTQTAYIDRTVQPQHVYVYTIEGVTQCEGEHVTSITKEGCCCQPTGMVRGYVRLANGIGLPGITVTATPDNKDEGNVGECVTDSTGYYEIGGLSYQGTGRYTLSAPGFSQSPSVTFDDKCNLLLNVNFYEQTYYNFAGYVLYEGTSIPVAGVRFLRDGMPVVDASGKEVTTNNQGAFLVNIPSGSHTIQVVKEGHTFENDGFYIDLDKQSNKHNWQKDLSDVYLWDQTKVTLQGRVVGGNVEGLKPLGESLSTNNLCDSLTLVMQLEGDNTSWIVRDQLDATVTERHELFTHGKDDRDTTRMDAYRHRIVIHPDPATGEYRVPLCPVKYKVTEIYGKGYPTLFQSGTFSETVDLTSYHKGDTATYSRIYHAQPTLDIWQFQGTQERYYGLKQYISRDNVGGQDTITLWQDGKYSMGHPVFMGGSAVPMVLSAREEYYYNNEKLNQPDVVQLDGGRVKIANGLVSVDETEEVLLDSVGQGTYVFTPQNTTFTLEDDMALRTMKFTLEYDSTFFDIQPIRAYVMAAVPKPQGRRIIAGQNVHLIDILRDPPGAASSAYIAEGSKMSYSYTADLTAKVGILLDGNIGRGSNYFTGIWAGEGTGTLAGQTHSSSNYASMSYDLSTKYYQDWSYDYEFETKEKISTSSHEREVGMNSDVYIGMTDNMIVNDAIAVRMVNSTAMKRLRPGMGGKIEVEGHKFNVTGSAKVLASGWDEAKKDSVYLVRDEVTQVALRINSTFAHSQGYLLEELIPTLLRTRNALLMDSTTTDAYAQALANKQKTPVYVSRVSTDNENFACQGSYSRILPEETTDVWNDTIQVMNSLIANWAGLITLNEKEKLEAFDLLKIYDFDGRASVTYSETFTTTEGMHRYWQLPTSVGLDFFKNREFSNNNGSGTHLNEREGQPTTAEFIAGGVKFSLKIDPQVGFNFNYKNGANTKNTKETGFTLSCARKSTLTVGVYRTHDISTDSIENMVKWGYVFYKNVEDNLKSIYNGLSGSSNTTSYISTLAGVPRYRNFVFRTLAGATASPWEEERKTMFYNPGAILDQATQQINKLRIWAKEPSVSNVPYGEPARFTIYLTNESETPDRITNDMKFYLEDEMNPNGAKIYIDGAPLTGTGIDLWMNPGVIYEKQVEVYAGAGYDYDNLGITLYDPKDVKHTWTVNLSAHFVPSAGPVNISKPGDKWVVNTESAYDGEKKLYYLPVHIDGYDVNFRNFDHIELQYKLSTQGDKDWVNVCSYYPNTDEGRKRMALASGEKKIMENDGFIDANFYGETDPVEQYYDLRAVCYCRQGNGYLTRSSSILSGIKDTRRPQAFGTPQPVNGILGLGDDIKIAFSEPIASNYLSPVNNFEVLGLTNQSSLSLTTALQFAGQSAAVSQVNRNLAGHSFTVDMMVNPRRTGKNMTVFTHIGSVNYSFLNLGIDAEGRLTANVNDIDIQSEKTVDFSDLHHVVYVFNVDLKKNKTDVTFYDDNTPIGQSSFEGMYDGTGPFVLGNKFEGEMTEVRLWNRALTQAEVSTYRNKRLTGTELGLLDYYPMDEGSGNYAYDKGVGSSDLILTGTTWKVPDGISLRLDGTETVPLNPLPFERRDYEDYTLMCWFRTTQPNTTLMSNGEARDEEGYKNHFNIGLENGNLYFRSGGQQVTANGYYSNDTWHHAAVTVNRSRNVGNLYVDQKLKQTFPVDTLGGIGGNGLCLGDSNGGAIGIDEVALFEMALPENVLKRVAAQTPTGEEMGLLVYLPFSRLELQSDNTQRLMPTGISLKRYKDNHGDVVESRRDTIVSQDIVDRLADRQSYAPMANSGKLENIKYSYVADGKDLLISLDVPDYQIEKTNVYITVKEVADLQGNLMASPVTMDLYVYRNPLRWTVKRKTVDMQYGEPATVEVTIQNLSGRSQDYTLEGLPVWITASQTSGKVAALGEEPVTLTISPYINIGDFDEVIYIVGENGITEPLPMTVRVRGEAPEWAVDDQLKAGNMTMHIVARVMIDNEVAHDTDDILIAVGPGHRTLGTAHVKHNASENDGLVYLTVYNTAGSNGTPLNFEFYDASSGRIYVMERPDDPQKEFYTGVDTIYFQADTIMGTAKNPVVLRTQFKEVQMVKLEKGWNWISTYLQHQAGTISDLLSSMGTWEVGESVELVDENGIPNLLTYKSVFDRQTYSNVYYWDNGDKTIELNPKYMYRIYAQSPKHIYLAGENVSYKEITAHHGWNRISYLSQLNLPIATALSDYTDMASEGDIIKSQDEFAVLNIDASGNRQWKGTLEYMRTGEGYMLKRLAETNQTFYYPYYTSSRYNNVKGQSSVQSAIFRNTSASSMNVIARIEGFDLQEGDRLVAYDEYGEMRGMTVADEDDGLFFLTVGGDSESAMPLRSSKKSACPLGSSKKSPQSAGEGIAFAIERNGEIVATTAQQMPYIDNGVQGSLQSPTVISFTSADNLGGDGWYSLQGIRLQGKPRQKGVYIHNGKRVTVK